jgi:hypothetical protein
MPPNTAAPEGKAESKTKNQDVNETGAISTNARLPREQNSASSQDSKLRKLKAKLFKH